MRKFIVFVQQRLQDIELKKITSDIIGTDQPLKIVELIKSTASYTKSDIEDIFFMEPSSGVVFGLLLSSGERVALKIYNKNISYTYLEKMNHIQEIFYIENFPAPKILSPIFKLNDTHAGIYKFIDGKKENGHNTKIRDELAKYLAKFSMIVDKHSFDLIYSFMQLSAKKKLWPIPHNILFDFNKTSRGAGWIAKKALQAKKILNSVYFEKRLAHTDWDVKNTIFKNKKLVGVFDWDSLGTLSEPEMVGRAAAQFTADWESGNKVTPSPDEARQFVESYEKYRHRKFNDEEYRVISASADYLIAMISRFEHAGGNPSIHPYQDLLRECKDKSFLFV